MQGLLGGWANEAACDRCGVGDRIFGVQRAGGDGRLRRAARTDANHAEIIAALRKAGCTVLDMSRLGGGAPDIAIGYGGLTQLAEIKDGSKSPSKRVLTPDEKKWHDTWTGGCRLILGVPDALEAANTLRRWSERLR